MRALLLEAVAVLALAAPSAKADHGFFGNPIQSCGPRIQIGFPRFSIEFGRRARRVHQHCFKTVCEREWVAPIYETCVVGYDPCGRPIYQRVLVRSGYWTTVEYRVCDCGVRTR